MPPPVNQALGRQGKLLAGRAYEAHEHEAALVRTAPQSRDRLRTLASAVNEYAALEGRVVHQAQKSEPKEQHQGDHQKAGDQENGAPDP